MDKRKEKHKYEKKILCSCKVRFIVIKRYNSYSVNSVERATKGWFIWAELYSD